MENEDKIPIENALPQWPRSNRFQNHWVGLHKHGFFFTHEPSFELEDQNLKDLYEPDLDDFDARRDYFCVPSVEYQRLRSVLENSKGGSVLITGYRGTGKSSLVKYTLYHLKADYHAINKKSAFSRNSNPLNPEYLDIRLNLSSVQNAEQVLPMMFKEFHEAICVLKKVKVSNPVLNEISSRYKKTTHTARSRSLPSILGIGGKIATTETEYERKRSSTAEVQSDLFHCVNHVFNENIKVVFIFDEIDKIAPLRERSEVSKQRLKQLQDIVGELKFILTESNAYHIFVAGKDVDDSWQEDQNKGEGLFESIFTLNIYLPSFFTPRLEYTLGPHRKWLLEKFQSEIDESIVIAATTKQVNDELSEKLYRQLFRQTVRRFGCKFCDILSFCGNKILIYALLLVLSLVVFSFLENTMKPSAKSIFANLLNKDGEWAMFTAFCITALYLTFKIGSNYYSSHRLVGNKRSQQKYKKKNYSRSDWEKFQNEKDAQIAHREAVYNKECAFIHSLVAELNISRKCWSFRTALLVLPHFAEYEIKGILYRRLERLRALKSETTKPFFESIEDHHKSELSSRKNYFECEFLEKLVGDESPQKFGLDIPSERKIRRIKLFIQYATYKGRGIPRKILREFYSFVTHRGIIKDHRFDTQYWKERDDVDFIFNIPHPILQKMSFFADITAHLERQMHFFRNLDDKGIVSTFHIIDFFLKFYQTGFSRRDIYNANFMIRRQELFPSQPLVERVIEMLNGFLISPIGETSPDFRLMPRVQTDLSKLYLNFGPDQLELRFTEAEFNVELEDLNKIIETGLETESIPKIESYRAESRKGRIYELLGNNFKARIAYSRSIRWILSDLHHQVGIMNGTEQEISQYDLSIEGNRDTKAAHFLAEHLPISIKKQKNTSPSYSEKFASGQILIYISESVELYLKLAQSHDVMNELDQALIYQNRAIVLGLTHSNVHQKSFDRINNKEQLKDFEDLFNKFPTHQNILAEIDDFRVLIDKFSNNLILTQQLGSKKDLFMAILGGISNLHDFLKIKKEDGYSHKPEIKEGEPLGILASLTASALVHEKLNERNAANETLLMGLFYLASTQNEYAIINHLMTMGNLACRRRNLNQAWLAYELALDGTINLRNTGDQNRGINIISSLEYSRSKQAELLRHLADIHYAVGDRVIFPDVETEEQGDEKFWGWVKSKFSDGRIDTRKDEYLYSLAQNVYQSIDDKLGVIDTLLIRLSVRIKALNKLLNNYSDNADTGRGSKKWKILMLEKIGTFLKGANVALAKLNHTTTEKGRIDPTSENEVIDHRRLGRLYESIGLFLQSLGEYGDENVNEILRLIFDTSSELDEDYSMDNAVKYIKKSRNAAFSIHNFDTNEPYSEAAQKVAHRTALKTVKIAATETLDLPFIRKNLESLLAFVLAYDYTISDPETTVSSNSSLRSVVTGLLHKPYVNVSDEQKQMNKNHHLINYFNQLQYSNDSNERPWSAYCDFLAEKCMLFSVVTLKKCIRDINTSRTNFEIGRFYLRKLVEIYPKLKEFSINHKDLELRKSAGRCYRWLHLASKRYLTAAIDILRDEKGSMRRNEALVGEVYATLADLMVLRRVAIEEIPHWHKLPKDKSYLKQIDDHLALDVQNQAFNYAILSLESHTKELTDYFSLYPIPHDVHSQHQNINNPLGHNEICTSIARRIILEYSPENRSNALSENSSFTQGSRDEINQRLSILSSKRNIVLPQGTYYTPNFDKFGEDFGRLMTSYNSYRYLRPFYKSEQSSISQKWNFRISSISQSASSEGKFFRTQNDELTSNRY